MLAGALSVPVCVEGIEDEAAYEAVVSLGGTIGQGWYFGKPMPAHQARDLLDTSRDHGGTPSLPKAAHGCSKREIFGLCPTPGRSPAD